MSRPALGFEAIEEENKQEQYITDNTKKTMNSLNES